MRASYRVWSGGTGKHGGKQRGTVYVPEEGDAPAAPAHPADGLLRNRAGEVVLVCGGRRPRHSWRPADPTPLLLKTDNVEPRPSGPRGAAPGQRWLRCEWCGWWMTAPEERPS